MAKAHEGAKMGATDILKEAWGVFSSKFSKLWLLVALLAVPSVLQAFIGKEFSYKTNEAAGGDFTDFNTYIQSSLGISVGELVFTTILLLIVFTLYQVFVQGATIKHALDLMHHRDVHATWDSIVAAGKKHFVPLLTSSIVVGVIVFVGFLLLVVPGIVAAILLSFTFFFVIDQNQSTTQAMKSSYEMVKSNFTDILVMAILYILIAIGLGTVVGLVASPFPDRFEAAINGVASAALGLFGALAFTRLYLNTKSRA